MVKNSTAFVGLDLGDKRSNVFILDQEGEPIEETRIPTTEPGFRRKFASLPPCRVAMEAGTHSRWASRLLEQLGHEVLVANPRRLRLIYENSRKADAADAEHLSRQVFYRRLTTIESVLDVDLDDAESCTSLHAAVMALESLRRSAHTDQRPPP